MLTLALIKQPAIVIGLRSIGPQRDGLVEVGQRLHRIALLPVDHAAPDIGRCIVAVDADGLVVVGECLIQFAVLAMQQAAIGIGLGVVGIEADRLVEIGERGVGISGVGLDRPAQIIGLRIVGVFLDDLGQRGEVRLRRRDRRVTVRCRQVDEARAAGERQACERRQQQRLTSLRQTPQRLIALYRQSYHPTLVAPHRPPKPNGRAGTGGAKAL